MSHGTPYVTTKVPLALTAKLLEFFDLIQAIDLAAILLSDVVVNSYCDLFLATSRPDSA
jgi:hypothetical protein